MNEEQDIKERIEMITTRNFTIFGCPEKEFQRFKKYAIDNAADGYWIALKQLLDIAETNAKDVMMYSKIMEIEERVSVLENVKQKQEKVKTFGMKREVKKDE